MTAFNDPQKLADAIALAQSFKTGQFSEKRHGKSKPRVEAIDIAGSSEIHRDPTSHTQRQRVAERNRQYAAAGFVQPSQRHYSSDVLEKGWQTGQSRAEDAVIGRAVFDFLSRNDLSPTPAATPKPTVKHTPTSETTGNFTGPRSPTLASASTPLTPESLIQGPGDKHTSPADSPQKPADEQEADQLAELTQLFLLRGEKSDRGWSRKHHG
ncbi:hypothetical protein J3458_008944 [Metarhizium acridum]|uniref:uncharacterized protein n=1 Tax=Metarhizium acridum TaxID=92637 RepID=UPI001C6B3D4D|nr:hypothetical protein J3458_008944 [Metarhizium acridum]